MAKTSEVQICLHVTSIDALDSILLRGLQPRLGPMSGQMESMPAIYLFPSWKDMLDAQWLFDGWAHEGEPALLAVDVRGLAPQNEAPFELVSYTAIDPSRITILAPTEDNWDRFVSQYGQMGGLFARDGEQVCASENFDDDQSVAEKSVPRKP